MMENLRYSVKTLDGEVLAYVGKKVYADDLAETISLAQKNKIIVVYDREAHVDVVEFWNGKMEILEKGPRYCDRR